LERVFLQFYAEARRKCVAVVAYGWESMEFYEKWLHDDLVVLADLRGLDFNIGSPQYD